MTSSVIIDFAVVVPLVLFCVYVMVQNLRWKKEADRLRRVSRKNRKEIYRREQDIRRLEVKVDKMFKQNTDFVANMAGEVERTLAEIMKQANACLETGPSPQHLEKLKVMLVHGHSLKNKVEQIKNFADLEFDRRRAKAVPVDLSAFLKDIVE